MFGDGSVVSCSNILFQNLETNLTFVYCIRRVNLFGEELENALRDKFQGHWYPDKPFKGSAYRCLKITDPSDPVLNRAARESGNPITDIIENLPADLAVWIDPGEVSYRMGEKGSVKILYSEKENNVNLEDVNPDVRGFLALDSLTSSLNGLSLSQPNGGCNGYNAGPNGAGASIGGSVSPLSGPLSPPLPSPGNCSTPNYAPSHSGQTGNQGQGHAGFQPRHPPVVYTAATFAQTKFGSTKLKTNSKKPNRMSPTEFSNYIKQRAIQKQQQQQQNCHSQYSQQGYYDKYYNNGGCYSNNSNNPNMNYNNFPKSPGSNPSSNDFGFGFGSSGMNNSLSSSSSNYNQSDYSSLLSEFSTDFDMDTNAFLQDILTSAGVGGGQPPKTGSMASSRQNSGGYDDWLTGGVGLGFNANSLNDSLLGPESRSSSTKSMSSGSESLPSPPSQSNEGFINPRVLVAN